jgi:hypothetical protein
MNGHWYVHEGQAHLFNNLAGHTGLISSTDKARINSLADDSLSEVVCEFNTWYDMMSKQEVTTQYEWMARVPCKDSRVLNWWTLSMGRFMSKATGGPFVTESIEADELNLTDGRRVRARTAEEESKSKTKVVGQMQGLGDDDQEGGNDKKDSRVFERYCY